MTRMARHWGEVLAWRVVSPTVSTAGLLVMSQWGLALIAAALQALCAAAPWERAEKGSEGERLRARRGAYATFGWGLVALNVLAGLRVDLGAWFGQHGATPSVLLGLVPAGVRLSVLHTNACLVEIEHREESEAKWARSPRAAIDSDGLALVALAGLHPATQHSYRVRACVAEVAGSCADCRWGLVADLGGSFKTLPEAHGRAPGAELIFTTSSCIQSRLSWGKSFSGFAVMARHKPDFSLWLGDAIYTDIPRGWLEFGGGFGTNDKLYRHEYRALRSEAHARRFWASTPTFFAFDDHEVYNDFSGRASDPETYDAALRSWDHYLGAVNPARLVPGGSRQYTFRAGAASFFVLDVRHHRSCTSRGHAGSVLGGEQLEQLKRWLLAEAASSPFLLIVSPVGVSRNRPEAWEGWNCAPEERQELLNFIKSRRLTNVLFISGDTHNPAIFELEPGVLEVGASPLDAFGHGAWGGTADRTLYEGTGMTTVFAKFTLSQDRLRVEIFGAGYSLRWQVGAILATFALLAIAAESSTRFARAFDAAPLAILLGAAVALAAAAAAIDDLARDPAFLTPRFVLELSAAR